MMKPRSVVQSPKTPYIYICRLSMNGNLGVRGG